MIRFVLMDLDDTVLDFGWAEEQAIRRTFSEIDLPVSGEVLDLFRLINRRQWRLLEEGRFTRSEILVRRFSLLFEVLGLDRDAETTQKRYNDLLGQGHRFLPGAKQMLDDLAGKFDLYLVSNGNVSVQNGRLESAGIRSRFSQIFLSEEVGADKPQKEFFDRCFAKIPGFDSKSAILLGDSLTSDILGGKRAGVRTCWLRLPGREADSAILPDYTITKPSEFVPLLERINATDP